MFTKQTISKAIVIPILPMQAVITFNQCMSVEKIHSTHLKASQWLSRCQILQQCYFVGPLIPCQLMLFRDVGFFCSTHVREWEQWGLMNSGKGTLTKQHGGSRGQGGKPPQGFFQVTYPLGWGLWQGRQPQPPGLTEPRGSAAPHGQ